MGQQHEEQANLRQRWEQAAQTIELARTQERQENTDHILQATLASLLTLIFIVGTAVWFAQRIMGH